MLKILTLVLVISSMDANAEPVRDWYELDQVKIQTSDGIANRVVMSSCNSPNSVSINCKQTLTITLANGQTISKDLKGGYGIFSIAALLNDSDLQLVQTRPLGRCLSYPPFSQLKVLQKVWTGSETRYQQKTLFIDARCSGDVGLEPADAQARQSVMNTMRILETLTQEIF